MFFSAVADACDQINARLAPYKEKLPEGSFREVVNAAYFDRVDLSAHGFYKTPDVTGFGGNLPFNYFTFGASCSEVELDTLTGRFAGLAFAFPLFPFYGPVLEVASTDAFWRMMRHQFNSRNKQ